MSDATQDALILSIIQFKALCLVTNTSFVCHTVLQGRFFAVVGFYRSEMICQ